MRAVGAFVGFVLAVVLVAAALSVAAWVVVMNLHDIAANGANFWNVLWLLVVGVLLFGGSSRAGR